MQIHHLHSWQISVKEAKNTQEKLRPFILQDEISPLSGNCLLAAADISFNLYSDILFGAVVLLDYPSLKILDTRFAMGKATFPYIPGYLSFREAPLLLEIFSQMKQSPDILLCDGHGIAHPRGMGLASHLGLFLDIPTIGCAKSLLVGDVEELAEKRGATAKIWYQGLAVGNALRTRKAGIRIGWSQGILVNCN